MSLNFMAAGQEKEKSVNSFLVILVNCAITAFLFGDWLHTKSPFIGGVFLMTLLLTLQMILKDAAKTMRRDN